MAISALMKKITFPFLFFQEKLALLMIQPYSFFLKFYICTVSITGTKMWGGEGAKRERLCVCESVHVCTPEYVLWRPEINFNVP